MFRITDVNIIIIMYFMCVLFLPIILIFSFAVKHFVCVWSRKVVHK